MAFTPVESCIGGMLIGLSAAMAYCIDGKIAGISGCLGAGLKGAVTCQKFDGKHLWNVLFILGLVLGGLVNLIFNRSFAFPHALDFSPARYLAAGLLIGVGTCLGNGCTSGHGICGLPRLSLRSWIAVPTFMAVAACTALLMRHVIKLEASDIDRKISVARPEMPTEERWHFIIAAAGTSLAIVCLVFLVPQKFRTMLSPSGCGLIFGVGLGCAGMTSQAKVLDFLDFTGQWDPSLAFVMGGGLLVNFPVSYWSTLSGSETLSGCEFTRPPKYGRYGSLVSGAACFGAGWGLIGICPGPALVACIPNIASGEEAGAYFALCFVAICLAWLSADYFVAKCAEEPGTTQLQVKPQD